MDQEHLIETITEELIRRLHTSESETERTCLVVGADEALADILSECRLTQCPAYEADTVKLESYEAVIVPCLSENQLVLASLGLRYGSESAAILDGLQEGRPVYILDTPASQTGTAIYRYYEECRHRLSSFGARFVSRQELSAVFQRPTQTTAPSICGPQCDQVPGCTMVDLSSRSVLSQREIDELCVGSCTDLVIGPKTVVTPLALDILRHRHITITRLETDR
ncbi:MAG: hypothetical protein CSA35_01230 [Dethiosulfovibrio peptidovorans]|nr:MAG: hypothetical protein CSA35_01230 [Dethiosulfovibrio peptidovorans]